MAWNESQDSGVLIEEKPRLPSVNWQIFRALALVAGFTLAVKLAALAKEMEVARSFGTGDALDAFLIAFALPSYVINVVAGSLQATLIPAYMQARVQGGRLATQRLFSNVVALSSVLLIACTILLAVLGPLLLPVLASGFSPEKLQLTRQLYFLLLPTVAINGLSSVWEGALNAEERFGLAALAPAVVPLITVAFLIFGLGTWNIEALVAGTVVGLVLQLTVVGWGLKRRHMSLWPRWHGFDPAVRSMMWQYVPRMAAAGIMSTSFLVDQAVAALDPGNVAILSYGNKLITPLLAIGTMALSTAILPYCSKLAASADWAGIRHTMKTYIRLILLAAVPVTIAMVVFSRPLVTLLFQRGRFTEEDSALVANVQSMYALQLPFCTLVVFFVRILIALEGNKLIVWGTIINVILNAVLDVVFLRLIGVAGIALSTSVVQVISCAYLIIVVYWRLGELSRTPGQTDVSMA